MAIREGEITVVQESRFQLTGEDGVSHLFTLGPHAGAEPDQLEPLAARHARIRVHYKAGDDIIGGIVTRIDVEDGVPVSAGRQR